MTDSIYNRTLQARIYNRALRMLRNHHDAQDVAQDVWLKWLKQAQNTVRKPEAWLNVATTHQVIDRLRTKRPDAEIPDIAGNHQPETHTMEQEARSRIASAIGELADRQREVLISKIYGEETFREIAERLEITESAVKTHYIRALQNLKEPLSGIHTENHS